MQCMEIWGGNAPVDRSFTVPGLEVWVYSQPYKQDARGGDVYYVSSCLSGRITRLLVADVSGHGQAVAGVATGLRDLMRRNVNLINQSRFVREMNQQFPVGPDFEIFATALVCTFFAPTQFLQFCNAGNPVPYLFREQAGSWSSAEELAQVVKGQGRMADTPLGIFQDADYSQFETKLFPEDMVLCASDALTESLDKSGNLLGADGLLKIVNQLDPTQPSQLIPQILRQVAAQHPGNLSQDDTTLLLFRANGTKSPRKNDWLAFFRWLRGVRDRTQLTETP